MPNCTTKETKAKRPERLKPLHDFLYRQDADCRLHFISKDKREVRLYVIGGKIILVTVVPDGGWDIFIPASDSLKVDETIAAVEAYLAKGRS